MKYTLLVLLLAATAYAAEAAHEPPFDLTVYVSEDMTVPPSISSLAEWMAGRILPQADVRVTWKHHDPPSGSAWRAHGMTVEFKAEVVPSEQCTLGRARPYDGSSVTILYNCMHWAEQNTVLASSLLAHTLAHEITHNLQGVDHHSETGIMKPVFTQADFCEMTVHSLPFTPLDLQLIRNGLQRRH